MEPPQVLEPTARRIPGGVVEVAASKSFTYPTRLAAAWAAGILEIHHPAYSLQRGELEFRIISSTRSTTIVTKNLFRKAYRKWKAPLSCDREYLFDCRFDTDRNIAHIMVSMATPALQAKQFFPGLKVILDAKPSKMVSTIFELLEIPAICSDRDFYGNIVSIDAELGDYELLYQPLFSPLFFPQADQQTPDRVFIARKGERSLINESEIEALLQTYGFQKFYYEDIPIHQQWTVTKNAECIVALHGAALSSLVFNHKRAKLIELFHPGYVVDMYRNTISAIGGSWCGVIGQITPDVIDRLDFKHQARAFALTPTKIDPRSLEMALEYMQIKPL